MYSSKGLQKVLNNFKSNIFWKKVSNQDLLIIRIETLGKVSKTINAWNGNQKKKRLNGVKVSNKDLLTIQIGKVSSIIYKWNNNNEKSSGADAKIQIPNWIKVKFCGKISSSSFTIVGVAWAVGIGIFYVCYDFVFFSEVG